MTLGEILRSLFDAVADQMSGPWVEMTFTEEVESDGEVWNS